eukprot:857700-Ditylum_brightwellii.AAC.1
MKLGMLAGNRFDIALRNVSMGDGGNGRVTSFQKVGRKEEGFSSLETPNKQKEGKEGKEEKEGNITKTIQCLTKIATSFQHKGFINYFGMQRFGKYHDTADVGIAVLKGNFELAIEIIMRPKGEDYEEEERQKQQKEEEQQSKKEEEDKYGGGGKGCGGGRKRQYDRYNQMKVGNARIRWSKRFGEILLINKDDNNKEDASTEKNNKDNEEKLKEAERKCAREILPQLGRFMVCEVSILSYLSRKPRDYKGAFGCIAKNLRLMFLHSYQSLLWNKAASYRMKKRIAEGETDGMDDAKDSCSSNEDVQVGDLVLIEDKSQKEGGSGTSGLQ